MISSDSDCRAHTVVWGSDWPYIPGNPTPTPHCVILSLEKLLLLKLGESVLSLGLEQRSLYLLVGWPERLQS